MASRVVQTSHETVTCEICGRTLLRGEHATMFRSGPGLHPVCELCIERAFGEGWVREGAPIGGPSQTRTARARSLVSRLRARLEDTHAPAGGNAERPGESQIPERHIHAVPSDVHGKLVRAVELFNASEHTKLVAGVIRSLGAPHVTLGPSHEELVVDVLVAWELCWYRFEADLDGEVVRKRAQGYELTELEGELGQPNAAADVDGGLALAV
jgi:hypothetical protein